MYFRTKITLVIILLTAKPSTEMPDNKGKEFMFAFMENETSSSRIVAQDPLSIFITTQSFHRVTVNITAPKFRHGHVSQTLTLRHGQVKRVTFNRTIRLLGTQKSPKGIRVSASDEIVIYSVNQEGLSTDAATLLPTDSLGKEYYAMCYKIDSRGLMSVYYTTKTQVLIVATQSHTRVGLQLADNPSVNVEYKGVNYTRRHWLNITLDKYDAFQMSSTSDLTGTYIVAEKPVSVMSGNSKTQIGIGTHGKDHLEEQLMPVESWGKTFATVPVPHRRVGDIFRIIPSEDNTILYFDNTKINLRKSGHFIEVHSNSSKYAFIHANKPICVTQFSLSQYGTDNVDPSMMIIPPIEQFAAGYTFTTPLTSDGKPFENYILFVVKGSDKNGLLLDDHRFPSSVSYHKINGISLVGGYINVTHGTHTIRHISPISGFLGILFGRAFQESYGFPIGMRTAMINTPCVQTAMVIGDGLDNDCDGRIDEEICYSDTIDDDHDGKINEDCAASWNDIYSSTTHSSAIISKIAQGHQRSTRTTINVGTTQNRQGTTSPSTVSTRSIVVSTPTSTTQKRSPVAPSTTSTRSPVATTTTPSATSTRSFVTSTTPSIISTQSTMASTAASATTTRSPVTLTSVATTARISTLLSSTAVSPTSTWYHVLSTSASKNATRFPSTSALTAATRSPGTSTSVSSTTNKSPLSSTTVSKYVKQSPVTLTPVSRNSVQSIMVSTGGKSSESSTSPLPLKPSTTLWFRYLETGVLALISVTLVGGSFCICRKCCLWCDRKKNEEDGDRIVRRNRNRLGGVLNRSPIQKPSLTF